jgi:alpha-beta hydrolase superfamily lysophospholipase
VTRRPPARPLYLDLASGPVFAVYHAPSADAPPSAAVLICPPWGWNDVTSYRARRAWAEHLADLGHPTLRFDLPGTGDSGGVPADADRLAAWTAATAGAAAWLRDATGGRQIAAIGMGLGGLVALKAIGEGVGIDEFVAWATPGSGHSFIRAERAFAALQASRYSLSGEPVPSVLPDGWMEVNGFVLSAETVAELEALTLAERSTRGLRRALLLDHDGIPVDAALRRHLEGAGVEVIVGAGPGWGAMTFHPERFDPPLRVFETVDAWLAAGSGAVRPTAVSSDAPVVGRDEAFLDVGGARVREAPFMVDHEVGTLFGILAEPVDGPRPPLAAIFLNAGAVRRIGPNRLWVEAARQAAAAGLPTLRVDLEGIGDSDGDAGRYRDVGEFYRNELGGFVSAFLDALEARGYGERFVLAGLCAGGFWAFNAADRDPRAVAALMVNPGALEWHPELVKDRNARKLQRLRRRAWWRRVLRGQIKRKNVVAVARATASQGWHDVTSLPRRVTARGDQRDAVAVSVERILDRLRDREVRVVMAFSDEEPVHAELERDGILAHLDRWPNLEMGVLPARDHTLRPIVAQVAVHELLDQELTRELHRVVDSPPAKRRSQRGPRTAPPGRQGVA